MKAKFGFIFSLFALLLVVTLTSCGTNLGTSIYLGAIKVNLDLSDTLSNSSKITGSFEKQGEALDDYYVLAYSNQLPKSSSYKEEVLFKVTKEQLEANSEVKFSIEINVDNMFPKDSESNTFYFVIHGNEFDTNSQLTYTTSDYTYSWSGSKVKLSW